MDLNVLGISGSLRAGSANTALVREAARVLDPARFDLADLRLPLYDGDLEAESGMPQGVRALREAIIDADAVIISTPEYNKAPPGVLKNALDWISREKPAPFADKPVAIMSAAAGRAGGERAQYALRLFLQPFGARLIQTPELMIAGASNAFDEAGHLANERNAAGLAALMDALRQEAARG